MREIMKRLRLLLPIALIIVAVLFAFRIAPVQAHEGRDVGPYRVELGWRVEPAFVGVANGPEVFISMKDDEKKKVEGAEKTLKLDAVFGDKTKTVALDAAEDDPGHYVASLIPTRPGDYTFHLTGKIGDTVVDEKFTSADGKFGSVEPSSDVLFPDSKMDVASLQAQIDALKADVDALKAAKK
ncbi:MAG: hypothetical protein ABI947_17765 [Chloroflexota bacterium]